MNILGLIPARGGSKGIPQKNITLLNGRPLIAYTLQAAAESKHLSRTIVSTDSAEIKHVAEQWGGEVPFLRPKALSEDDTPALPVIQHAINYLSEQDNWQTEIAVYLQPTSPFRAAHHIDEAIQMLIENNADSVVSVVEVPHQYNPISVMKLTKTGLIPFLDATNTPQIYRRQDKPIVYARNGPAIVVTQANVIIDEQKLYGENTLPYIMSHHESLDIDDIADLKYAEWLMRGSP